MPSHNVFVFQHGETDYEAVDSDGTTIDSGSNGMQVLQAGIDAAPDGGTIYVDGEYTYDDADDSVTLGDEKRLVGYSATFYNELEVDPEDYPFPAIVLAEGVQGDWTDVVQDVSSDDNHIHVEDASAFSEGDLIRIIHYVYYSAEESSYEAEGHAIREVDTENDIIITVDPVYFDYLTENNAQVRHIDPDTGHIEGITMEGLGPYVEQTGIQAYYGKDCIIENVHLSRMGYRLVDNINSYGTILRDSILERSNVNGDGYGIRVRNGCNKTRIVDNVMRLCRHPVAHSAQTSEGLPRETYIVDNTVVGHTNSSALDAHDGTISWYILGNHLYPGHGGRAITSGAKESVVEGNIHHGLHDEVEDRGGFWGPRSQFSWQGATVVIRNNYISRSRRLAVLDIRDNNMGTYKNITIQNNFFEEPRYTPIRIRPVIDTLNIIGNHFEAAEQGDEPFSCIVFNTSGDEGPAEIYGGTVKGNTISRYGHRFWWEDDVATIENMTIADNTFIEPMDGQQDRDLFTFSVTSNSVIKGNTIQDPDGDIDTVFDLGNDASNNLIRDNDIRHDGSVTTISDSGTDNTDHENFESTGSGWTEVT